jgi:hypothetical protein
VNVAPFVVNSLYVIDNFGSMGMRRVEVLDPQVEVKNTFTQYGRGDAAYALYYDRSSSGELEATTEAEEVRVKMLDLDSPPVSVDALQINFLAGKSGTDDRQVSVSIHTQETTSESPNIKLKGANDSDYRWYSHTFTVNPATGLPFNGASVTDLEASIKVKK